MTEAVPIPDAAASEAAPTPFTMVAGDPAALVCEGDVCYVPGLGEPGDATPAR